MDTIRVPLKIAGWSIQSSDGVMRLRSASWSARLDDLSDLLDSPQTPAHVKGDLARLDGHGFCRVRDSIIEVLQIGRWRWVALDLLARAVCRRPRDVLTDAQRRDKDISHQLLPMARGGSGALLDARGRRGHRETLLRVDLAAALLVQRRLRDAALMGSAMKTCPIITVPAHLRPAQQVATEQQVEDAQQVEEAQRVETPQDIGAWMRSVEERLRAVEDVAAQCSAVLSKLRALSLHLAPVTREGKA